MRFKELLEYKRDITVANYKDKFWARLQDDPSYKFDEERLKMHNTTIDEEIDAILEEFEEADPSPNKQYVLWMLETYIGGGISRLEDVTSTTADLLERYHTLKVHRKLPPSLSDIGKFRKQGAIIDLTFDIETRYNEFVKDKPEAMPKGESTEILNNDEVRIIIPEDKDAACYYGQGTMWCTAARKNNMFDSYAFDNSPLFIIIPKQPTHAGEKYQVHLLDNEWMDEQDKEVSPNQIMQRFPKTDFKKVLGEYDSDANYVIAFMDRGVILNLISQITDHVVKNKDEIIDNWLEDDTQGSKDAHSNIINTLKNKPRIEVANEVMDMMDIDTDRKVYDLPEVYGNWLEVDFNADSGLYHYIYDKIKINSDLDGPFVFHYF